MRRSGQSTARSATAVVVFGIILLAALGAWSPSAKAAGPGMDVTDGYVPAGYMGDISGITMDETYPGVVHAPATSSIRVTYHPTSPGWAGVYYLRVDGRYPQGNWGDEPGLDLRFATSLSFWARGERGGELVEFKAGGMQDPAKPYGDSFSVTLGTRTLTPGWLRYTIPLAGQDLSSVLGAFAWVAKSTDNPGGMTFYLSELTFDGTPPDWAPTVTPTPTPVPTPPATISDGAYAVVNDRVNANRQNMFLYKDDYSAFNHGFPSGWFGSPGTLSKIALNAACIDDPTSAVGCATNPTSLDRQRGTVLSISFAPLVAREYAGVNVVEPDQWDANQPQPGKGYDLRGATRIIFDVRSPTTGGAKVQFGVGMKTTPFIQIPQSATYTTRYVSLAFLGLSPADLANDHVLFTIVTNHVKAPNGATILLDNIHFDPVPIAQQSALGLPLSTETFGVIPEQTPSSGRVTIAPDQVNRNVSTTYESAMALIALLNRAKPQDLDSARLIADTLHYALSHDNQGDKLPSSSGAVGVHSGYSGGDISLFNNQTPPAAGRAGDIRLSGFGAGTATCGPSGTCLVLDGATGGNAALAGLGLVATYLHPQGGDTRYLQDARLIGKWIEVYLTDRSGTGFGGYFLGYPDGGMAKVLIQTKSIENNADIYAFFTALAVAETRLGNTVGAAQWTTDAAIAGDFVMALFDQNSGCFNAGTTPVGTPPSPGIDPRGPVKGTEVTNIYPYLDSNSFITLALAQSGPYGGSIDWRRPVRCVHQFAQSIKADNQTFNGFSITQSPTAGPNGVAWEFTGQAVVAMELVARKYGDSEFDADIAAYLAQIRQAQLASPFTDGEGLVATTQEDGDHLPPYEQCLSTPWQCFPARVGLAATTWAIFADQKINPMQPGITLACSARPAIAVSAVANGRRGLLVTVRETGFGVLLQSLQFDATSNGLIDAPGYPPGSPGPITIGLGGVVQTTFTVRQQTAGIATQVPFKVVDDCAAWPTFVGGGASAVAWTGGGAAAPSANTSGASSGRTVVPTSTVVDAKPRPSSASAANTRTGADIAASGTGGNTAAAPGTPRAGAPGTGAPPALAGSVGAAGPLAPIDPVTSPRTPPSGADPAGVQPENPAPGAASPCGPAAAADLQTTVDPTFEPPSPVVLDLIACAAEVRDAEEAPQGGQPIDEGIAADDAALPEPQPPDPAPPM